MVMLGRIVPEHFLDGGMALDRKAALHALVRLGRELGTGASEAARGVVAVANATIERALRAISVERGHDVRGAALVAFGGAGPLHACELAAALGAGEVLVPPAAGILSAWGLLGADEVFAEAATLLLRVPRSAAWPRVVVARAIARLERTLVSRHGRGGRLGATFALRYQGQSFELRLPASVAAQDLRKAFDRAHLERYGYARADAAIEIVEIELSLTRPGPRLPAFPTLRKTLRDARLGTHPVALARGARPAPVWRRESLGRDFKAPGPCLVIEYGATTFVPPGWRVRLDALANLRLERA
jgi:N-methylhydantoinase A